MGPTCGPSGPDRTQVGPMLAPWTWLSGKLRLVFCLPWRKYFFQKKILPMYLYFLKKWSVKCWDFRPFTTSIFPAAKHTKVESLGFNIWIVGYYVEFGDGQSINIWIVCIHWRVFVLMIDTGREWRSVWGQDRQKVIFNIKCTFIWRSGQIYM